MILVFSDIDGTLLARMSHSFSSVKDYIASLHNKATIILATSKTIRETHLIQKELGLVAPCIAENGGVIYIPYSWKPFLACSNLKWVPYSDGWYTCTGKTHDELVRFLQSCNTENKITLFSQMNNAELESLTALSGERLCAARERYASEPFLCSDSEVLKNIHAHACKADLTVQRGGIFYHCMHKGQDKAEGVRTLIHMLIESGEPVLHTIALGDAPNDFAMLRMADYPVLIPHQGHPYSVDIDNLRIATSTAPKGWIESLTDILYEISMNTSRKEQL